MDTAHTPDSPAPASASRSAVRPRRCNADYRWTQPKVIAFLEALSRCGKVAEAAHAVGMSRTSAYRLRARLGSARFAAAFEGARRNGIRARAVASAARLAAVSPWEGPGMAELVARERAFAQGESSDAQGFIPAAQGDTLVAQGAARTLQGDAPHTQGDAFHRKETEKSLGQRNTRSMSPSGDPRAQTGGGS